MSDRDQEKNGEDKSNVIAFRKRGVSKETQPVTPHEPMINLPPVTKYFLGLILIIHLIVTFILNAQQYDWVFTHLGFIPARFSGGLSFEPIQLITPLSHMLLHGSWLHILMNGVMLLAFGSGIEKWVGGKTMIKIFIISGLFGVVAHFILSWDSVMPVVGASGGLSGLFAVAIIMLHRQNTGLGGRYGVWPIVILWIVISLVFGVMGSPDGSPVAWAAHIGGFLGGFAALKFLKI